MRNILRWIGLVPFSFLCSIAGYWVGIFAYSNILNTVSSGFDWSSFNSNEISITNIGTVVKRIKLYNELIANVI